jgi:hypothetical protein
VPAKLVSQVACERGRQGFCLPRPPVERWGRALMREGFMKPTENDIRQRAHEIWEKNGRPEDRDEEFWHQAERELFDGRMDEPSPSILPG